MEQQEYVKKDKKPRPGWIRALDIATRIVHIAAGGVLFGGAVFAIPFAPLLSWRNVAAASGLILVMLGINQSRHWFYQVRGIVVTCHVALLFLVHVIPEYRAYIVAVALALGVAGSHMPGSIRHWSLRHGCRID